MKLERLLGLLAMTGITLLALFLFFPSRHTDDISTVDSSIKTDLEQPILSVTKDFKILSESNFDFYVYRAHVLSSENNALRLTEQIKKGGMPSFVEIFNKEKNLFAVYVGPFLSEDDILNNIDTIKKLSESNQGEVQPWKL
tara:strand:- start:524 stop:946 length:423 start_codon:yes stop_codon:yes gene_type:complete